MDTPHSSPLTTHIPCPALDTSSGVVDGPIHADPSEFGAVSRSGSPPLQMDSQPPDELEPATHDTRKRARVEVETGSGSAACIRRSSRVSVAVEAGATSTPVSVTSTVKRAGASVKKKGNLNCTDSGTQRGKRWSRRRCGEPYGWSPLNLNHEVPDVNATVWRHVGATYFDAAQREDVTDVQRHAQRAQEDALAHNVVTQRLHNVVRQCDMALSVATVAEVGEEEGMQPVATDTAATGGGGKKRSRSNGVSSVKSAQRAPKEDEVSAIGVVHEVEPVGDLPQLRVVMRSLTTGVEVNAMQALEACMPAADEVERREALDAAVLATVSAVNEVALNNLISKLRAEVGLQAVYGQMGHFLPTAPTTAATSTTLAATVAGVQSKSAMGHAPSLVPSTDVDMVACDADGIALDVTHAQAVGVLPVEERMTNAYWAIAGPVCDLTLSEALEMQRARISTWKWPSGAVPTPKATSSTVSEGDVDAAVAASADAAKAKKRRRPQPKSNRDTAPGAGHIAALDAVMEHAAGRGVVQMPPPHAPGSYRVPAIPSGMHAPASSALRVPINAEYVMPVAAGALIDRNVRFAPAAAPFVMPSLSGIVPTAGDYVPPHEIQLLQQVPLEVEVDPPEVAAPAAPPSPPSVAEASSSNAADAAAPVAAPATNSKRGNVKKAAAAPAPPPVIESDSEDDAAAEALRLGNARLRRQRVPYSTAADLSTSLPLSRIEWMPPANVMLASAATALRVGVEVNAAGVLPAGETGPVKSAPALVERLRASANKVVTKRPKVDERRASLLAASSFVTSTFDPVCLLMPVPPGRGRRTICLSAGDASAIRAVSSAAATQATVRVSGAAPAALKRVGEPEPDNDAMRLEYIRMIAASPHAGNVMRACAAIMEAASRECVANDLTWFAAHVPLGTLVDARDVDQVWCIAVVMAESRDAGVLRRFVRVRYAGWDSVADEWLSTVEGRIAPVGSYTAAALQSSMAAPAGLRADAAVKVADVVPIGRMATKSHRGHIAPAVYAAQPDTTEEEAMVIDAAEHASDAPSDASNVELGSASRAWAGSGADTSLERVSVAVPLV